MLLDSLRETYEPNYEITVGLNLHRTYGLELSEAIECAGHIRSQLQHFIPFMEEYYDWLKSFDPSNDTNPLTNGQHVKSEEPK